MPAPSRDGGWRNRAEGVAGLEAVGEGSYSYLDGTDVASWWLRTNNSSLVDFHSAVI